MLWLGDKCIRYRLYYTLGSYYKLNAKSQVGSYNKIVIKNN